MIKLLVLAALLLNATTLRITITPTTLVKQCSRESIQVLLQSFSLAHNVLPVARLLSNREFDLQSYYSDIIESEDRIQELLPLYYDPGLHEVFFNVRKLKVNMPLAVFVAKGVIPYHGSIVSKTAAIELEEYQLYTILMKTHAYLTLHAVQEQMGMIESWLWLDKYLWGFRVTDEDAMQVMTCISPNELVPQAIAILFPRLLTVQDFLKTFIGAYEEPTLDLLMRNLAIVTATRLYDLELSASQEALLLGMWVKIRKASFVFGDEIVPGRIFYKLANSLLWGGGCTGIETVLNVLRDWALLVPTRSCWGLLTDLIRIFDNPFYAKWYFKNLKQSAIAPVAFIPICEHFLSLCKQAKEEGHFDGFSSIYFPIALQDPNTAVQTWMRLGHFSILSEDLMYYESLSVAEARIQTSRTLPLNVWIDQAWIGDVFISKLEELLSRPPELNTQELMRLLPMTIPYLLMSKRKLNFQYVFAGIKFNASWCDFYSRLVPHAYLRTDIVMIRLFVATARRFKLEVLPLPFLRQLIDTSVD